MPVFLLCFSLLETNLSTFDFETFAHFLTLLMPPERHARRISHFLFIAFLPCRRCSCRTHGAPRNLHGSAGNSLPPMPSRLSWRLAERTRPRSLFALETQRGRKRNNMLQPETRKGKTFSTSWTTRAQNDKRWYEILLTLGNRNNSCLLVDPEKWN